MSTATLTHVDLENEMLRVCRRMEEDIEILTEVSNDRAEAESSYKYKHARAMIEQTEKTPVATKEAHAHLRASEDYKLWKILEGREKATQQSLIASRSRLDALRTICANVRATGV